MRTAAVAALAVGALACGPRTGTELEPIAPQTAVVGQELAIMLRVATTAHVDYAFASPDLDLDKRLIKPTLTAYANGEAMFRWTPLASDLGDHQIRFTATVDGVPASELVPVSVIGGADPIRFRAPVGEGTTLDLSRTPCAIVPLLVDDTSATEVDIEPGAGWPANAKLDRDGPLSGRLRFCPTKDQAQATTIFPFSLVATDDGGARAEKRYTVVLGTLPAPVVPPAPAPGPSPTPSPSPTPDPMPTPTATCDTGAPVITHTPHADITTVGNPHINAELADGYGIYGGTVFWSTDPPADPDNPDILSMNYVDMQLLSGTLQDGQWGATIPSPVADSPAGTTATIYYVIVASDADDAVAGCDYHVTFNPTSGVYSFVIKRAQSSSP